MGLLCDHCANAIGDYAARSVSEDDHVICADCYETLMHNETWPEPSVPRLRIRSVDDVLQALAAIREVATDDETAHRRERALYIGVLRAVAAGGVDGQALATNALGAEKIGFYRWFA